MIWLDMVKMLSTIKITSYYLHKITTATTTITIITITTNGTITSHQLSLFI